MHVWMDTQCSDCTEWWRTVADLFPYNQVHNIRTGCNSPPLPQSRNTSTRAQLQLFQLCHNFLLACWPHKD